ncbi:MAG: hypothetical protein ACXVEI_13550 [Actinomycetota bacterium]
MSFRRILPRVVALAAVAALVVTLFSAADGREPGPVAPPPLRQHPNIGPFQGMGVWVDLYDDAAWADPGAAVAGMAANGVRTLYLETSNFNRSFPFADKQGVAAFVDAAHDDGVQIVAWYLPGFVNVGLDAARSKAAIRFRTDAGNGFDGFALDIENPDVTDVSVRTARLLDLSRRVRSFAGESYPLGGIIPSPRGIVVHKDYWPGFPYADLAAIYDVLMPMSYFTWHHPTGPSTHLYLTQNIRIIQREVGSDQVPIHVIGGIAQDASLDQAQAFVNVLRERGAIGGSYYTYTGVHGAEWSVLQRIPANPVESPAMPVAPGPLELGNIPGSDTTHGTGVVYAVGGYAGDRTLTYDAFDAQDGEITIYVNWVARATVDVGPDGDWTGPRQLLIPDDLFVDGQTNTIAFVPADPSGTWGVRGVAVTKAP